MPRPDQNRPATKDELAMARAEFRTEMADLREQFHRDFMAAFAAQKRTLVPGLVVAYLLIAASNVLAVVVG